MHISFDLDSTLIPHGNEFEAEKRTFFAKFLNIEPIRVGTSKLISDLQAQGHTIHIYTTSFRKKTSVRLMLYYYGIRAGKIINEYQNQRTLRRRNINASKYPPAFGFELHIDDSKGVEIEGERLNFKTIIIKTNDENWIEKIRQEIILKQ